MLAMVDLEGAKALGRPDHFSLRAGYTILWDAGHMGIKMGGKAMTRICSYCKKPMGWKCGECGLKSKELFRLLNWMAKTPDWGKTFICPNNHIEGPEPYTHGICNECERKEKEKVR